MSIIFKTCLTSISYLVVYLLLYFFKFWLARREHSLVNDVKVPHNSNGARDFRNSRSSRSQIHFKIDVLKNFALESLFCSLLRCSLQSCPPNPRNIFHEILHANFNIGQFQLLHTVTAGFRTSIFLRNQAATMLCILQYELSLSNYTSL